jgi:hypothetical protein
MMPFIINPNLSSIDIEDAIFHRLQKIKAIVKLTLNEKTRHTSNCLTKDQFYYILWILDDTLDEIEKLKSFPCENQINQTIHTHLTKLKAIIASFFKEEEDEEQFNAERDNKFSMLEIVDDYLKKIDTSQKEI